MKRRQFLLTIGAGAMLPMFAGCTADPEHVNIQTTQDVEVNPKTGDYIINVEGTVENNNDIYVGARFRADLLVDGRVVKEEFFQFNSVQDEADWSHTFLLSPSDVDNAGSISINTELLRVWNPDEESANSETTTEYY